MRLGIRNQRGQMTIEMMLISVFLLGIAISISKYSRSNGLMANLIEKPWLVVQGMIEDGVWKKAGPSKLDHPNRKKRHGTAEGEMI